MSDDHAGCEWVSFSFGTGLPGLSQTKAVKRLCVCVCKSVTKNRNYGIVFDNVSSLAGEFEHQLLTMNIP